MKSSPGPRKNTEQKIAETIAALENHTLVLALGQLVFLVIAAHSIRKKPIIATYMLIINTL